jgi:hypothetical protein
MSSLLLQGLIPGKGYKKRINGEGYKSKNSLGREPLLQ